mgnify:CR=1 FL=1
MIRGYSSSGSSIEGVYAAGDTSSSEEKDSHSEFDTGAFDTVTRATANHGLHRGSYQTEATIIAEDGTRFDVSYWEDKGSTLYLTDGSKVKWNRGSITTEDGKTYTMGHYEIYGLKYVPVAVKTADYADFCKKYNVVNAGETISGGYGEMNLQSYVGLIADVTADTNGNMLRRMATVLHLQQENPMEQHLVSKVRL